MRGYLSCQGHILYEEKLYSHEVIVIIQQSRALSPASYTYTTSKIFMSANLSASMYD